MLFPDAFHLASQAIQSQPLRAWLIVLAMAIGVAAVNLLTALGDSARQYVVHEFEALGTHLLIVLPGRSETTGGHPPLFGETPRDLTLADAEALLRNRHVAAMAPVTIGSAPVSVGGLERDSTILGSNHALLRVRHLTMAQGQFLPELELDKELSVCVIGKKIHDDLFAGEAAIGQWLRINDRRFRVIGVLAEVGQSIGTAFDEVVMVPVASAQALFNTSSLFRILVETNAELDMQATKDAVRDIIKARHEGEDDVTIISQDSVVSTFDKILRALTLTVAGIAAVSLAVAGVLVMNVMLVSVTQRTAEIGLLKALGASRAQLLRVFLLEAALLSLAGAVCGSLLGQFGIAVLQSLYPNFPLQLPLWARLAALAVALLTGLIFGVMPARKAARLDPVSALARR